MTNVERVTCHRDAVGRSSGARADLPCFAVARLCRHLWRAPVSMLGAFLILMATAVTPRTSVAQYPPVSPIFNLFPKARWDGIRDWGRGGNGSNVDPDPDIIVFDDTTRTATFTFVNPTDQPKNVWITPECGGDGNEQPEDPFAAAWHNTYPCVVPWLSGYPQYLLLAPHERRTIPLQLIPYPTLPDGRYLGRLMYVSPGREKLPSDTLAMDTLPTGGGPHDEIAIEYVKGPKRPQRVRTRWAATVPAAQAGALVQATPSVMVMDDRTRTATFTLRNPGATPTELWLILDCPWFRVHYDSIPEFQHKSQYEMAWHLLVPNIVAWVSGYPQHLVLAPYEQRTISLQLIAPHGTSPAADDYGVPPGSYPVGSYYAQVRYVQSPMLTVTAAGDTTFATPQGTVDLVYNRGPAPLQLALSDLRITRHSDKTSQACVTMQQPGIGVVAALHAEVKANAGSTPWRLDTTVVVWQVVHDSHNLLRLGIGSRIIPDPVCFALPAFARGQYQLHVSAHALGNAEERMAPVSWEIP
jgi:hypothetical protein